MIGMYAFWFFLLILCSCESIVMDPPRNKLYLLNKSKKNITLLIGRGVYGSLQYPELLPSKNDWKKYAETISPDKSEVMYISSPIGEYIDTFPLDTMAVFVFDPDTLDAYPWEVIRDEYKVLKTHFITIDDVLKSDTIVVYP